MVSYTFFYEILCTVLYVVPCLSKHLPLSPHAHFKGEITPDLVRKTAGLAQIQITEEEVSVKLCLVYCAWLICSFCWRTLC